MIAVRFAVPRTMKVWAWRSQSPRDTEVNLRLRNREGIEITFSGYVDDLRTLLDEWQSRLVAIEAEIRADADRGDEVTA